MLKKGFFVHKLCIIIGFSLIVISVLGYLSYTGRIALFGGNTTNTTTTTPVELTTTTTIKTETKPLASEITTTLKTTTTEETTTTKKTTSTSTTTTVEPSDHVVFSEVFYDTPGDDDIEEWIELYNPTSDFIDLSGLTIEDNENIYTISNGTTISSDEFMVIARDETGFQDLYGELPDLNDLTLRLNNEGDYLKLKNGSEEIDMVAWENYVDKWDLEADEGESIQRNPSEQDTSTDNDWIITNEPDPEPGGMINITTTTTVSTTTTTSETTTSTITTSTTESSTTSTSTSTTTSTTTTVLGNLNVNVIAEMDPIARGNDQTIITEVTDGTNPVEGALVNVTVTYASGSENDWCSDLTNSSGISICTHTISGGATTGIFTVNSTATKENYALGIGYATFNVTSAT